MWHLLCAKWCSKCWHVLNSFILQNLKSSNSKPKTESHVEWDLSGVLGIEPGGRGWCGYCYHPPVTELRKVKSSAPVTQPVCGGLGIKLVCPCLNTFFFKEEKQEFYKMIGLSLNYIFRKVILLFSFLDSHLKVWPDFYFSKVLVTLLKGI